MPLQPMAEVLRVDRSDAPLQRRLAAVAFLDVVGYSRLMGGDDETTLREWLAVQCTVIEPRVMAWRGRVVSRSGDGMFVEFRSVLDAFRWAVDVQNAAVLRVQAGSQIQLRIALHLGDVMDSADGEVLGDGVNTAARLQSYAKPGGVVVSQAVANEVLGKTNAVFSDLGTLHLRNIARPVRAFQLNAVEVLPRGRHGHWFKGKAGPVGPAPVTGAAEWLRLLTRPYAFSRGLIRSMPKAAKRALALGVGLGGAAALVALLAGFVVQYGPPQVGTAVAAVFWRGSSPAPRDEATRLFTQGRAIVCSYPCPREWLAARALFEQAIAADPDYALPYAAAAFTYTNFVTSNLSLNKNEDLHVAERLATRAAALAPDQALAHEARGAVLRQNPDRLEDALAAYLRSLAIDPNQSSVRANAGWMLVLLGRPLEAEPYLRAAIAAEPNHPRVSAWLTYLGLAELFSNHEGHGANSFSRALALQKPGAAAADISLQRSLNLAAALALNGAVDEARLIIDRLRSQNPTLSTGTLMNCDCSHNPGFLAGYKALRRGAILAGVPETQ